MKKFIIALMVGIILTTKTQATTTCPDNTTCYNCGDDCLMYFSTDTETANGNQKLNIIGSGKMERVNWFNVYPDFDMDITNVEIGTGITSVAGGVFDSFYATKKLTFSDTVTSIEGDIGGHMSNLTDLTISDSLSSLYLCEGCKYVSVNDKADLISGCNSGQYDQTFCNLAMERYSDPDYGDNEGFFADLDEYRSVFSSLDLSHITIHCLGNLDTCESNLTQAGYADGTYTIIQASVKNSGESNTPKRRIYTIEEASAVVKPDKNTFKLRYR